MSAWPLPLVLALAALAAAQDRPTLPGWPAAAPANRQLDDGSYLLAAGTRIPLSLMTTVSTRNAAPGDQVYFHTLMPVAVDGRIVVPAGSYVTGTVVQATRPGKVKGRGELALRFDRLMLASGASYDLLGKPGSIDGDNPGELDREEGKLTGPGSQGRDAMIVAVPAWGGTMMGRWIGGQGRDAAIGAGAGGAAGLAAVLLTRGPDATLRRGSTIEMVLNGDVRLSPGSASGASTPPPPVPRGRRR